MRLRHLALLASLIACAPLLSACEDNRFLATLVLASDTAVIGVPGSPVEGTALDLVRANGDFDLIRTPEQFADAEQWDVALRATDSGLVFRPFRRLISNAPGAGIAVSTQAFDAIAEAPENNAAYSSDPVPVTENGVYVLRSRQFTGNGLGCVKYAKMRVLEVNESDQTVRVALVINEGCLDERLADD